MKSSRWYVPQEGVNRQIKSAGRNYELIYITTVAMRQLLLW